MTYILRDYQREAVDAGLTFFTEGSKDNAIQVLPTGSGKSLVIAGIAQRLSSPTLVFQPTKEILEQNYAKLVAYGERPTIYSASLNRKIISPLTLATIGSVRTKPELFTKFSNIIIDESHLVNPKKGMYSDFLAALGPGRKVMGLTATPYRLVTDGFGGSILKFLTRTRPRVFQKVIYHVQNGVLFDRGYLAKLEYIHSDKFNSDQLELNTTGADFTDRSVRSYYKQINFTGNLLDAVGSLLHSRKNILVFTRFVEEAQNLVLSLGSIAEIVTAQSTKREREGVIGRFRSGQTRIVANVGILTTGFDFPELETVVLGRPTMSLALYCFDGKTELLTPDGWRNGLDLLTGETVAAFRKEDNSVRWEKIEGYVRRPLHPSEYMVSLQSPTVDIRVTDSHRMIWHPAHSNSWRISPAGDLKERSDNWFLPVAGYEKVSGIPLTDAEIAFVGWVQTDGHVNRENGAITIVQQSPEQCKHIEGVLTECGFKWRVSEHCGPTNYGPRRFPCKRYRMSRGAPRGEDKHLTGWGRLFSWIPKADPYAWKRLESLDERQWAVLLDAWHRGDGSKQANQSWARRSYHLATADKNVADWLQSMCMRRGWRANIAKQANLWMVHCRPVAIRSIAGSKRISSPKLIVSPTGNREEVWCVSVASGAVITRRNGKGCIMGQSQMIGRGMRPYPAKAHTVIYDLCDNISKFGKVEDLWLGKERPGSALWCIRSRGRQLTNIYYGEKAGARW